jgi:hypothetical protein
MKGLTVAFILAFVLLVLMATNPTLEDHREAVKDLALKEMGRNSSSSSKNGNEFSKLGEQIGENIGRGMLDMMVNNLVTRDNYLIFSATRLKQNDIDKPKTVGYGFLGNVYMMKLNKMVTKDEKAENNLSSTFILEYITLDEVSRKFQYSTATEGSNISLNKTEFDKKKFVCFIYANTAYIKIGGEIIRLSGPSSRNIGNIKVYQNNSYNLMVNKLSIRENPNGLMDGEAFIEGEIELSEKTNRKVLTKVKFYTEGF